MSAPILTVTKMRRFRTVSRHFSHTFARGGTFLRITMRAEPSCAEGLQHSALAVREGVDERQTVPEPGIRAERLIWSV
ncbi:hypothetical protein [Paraburkholderia kururiensis]|uniref:hypothetical protein n=1 Tax=Paraburkholderia kururiensis TaxID=984307 RepID=UPI0012E018F9|nr:hypothetical protein [Paraburkholderia kururiensis]